MKDYSQRSSAPRRAGLARFLTHVVRWARLSAFVSVALAIALAVSVHHARGEVGERMFSLGRELGPLGDLLQGTQSTRINGENMFFASTVTDQPFEVVLDRFERHCLEQTGGLKEGFDALPEAVQNQVSQRASAAWRLRNGVLREQNEREGMVVCVARSGKAGLREWVRDLRSFLDDGEVSHLGNLRYAYAERTETGQTHLLSTFTQGPFNLYRALGEQDVTQAPRLEAVPLPPGARHPMTFRVDDMPYAAQVLQVPGTPAEATAYYLKELPKQGWERIMGPGEVYNNVVMRRQGVVLTLAALELGGDSGGTSVTLTEGAAQ